MSIIGLLCNKSILLIATHRYRIYIHVKAFPLQAWTEPEGSRRLRFPDFKTIGT